MPYALKGKVEAQLDKLVEQGILIPVSHSDWAACECGTSEQTMQHLLRCPLLENECSLEDLATANEKALHCARAWPSVHMTKFGDDGHERRTGQLQS